MTANKELQMNVRSQILFLEDEAILALTFVQTLEELDIGAVHQASDLDEARRVLDEHAIDIAVLDVNVNGASSFDVARRVIESGGNVVFATGYSFDPSLFDEFDCPILRKPYEERELCDTVKGIHEERAKAE